MKISYSDIWLNGKSDVEITFQFQQQILNSFCSSFVIEFPYKFGFQRDVVNKLQCKLYNLQNFGEIVTDCYALSTGIVKLALQEQCFASFQEYQDFKITIQGLSTPSSDKYSQQPVKMYVFTDEVGSYNPLAVNFRRFQDIESLLPKFFGNYTPQLRFRWQVLPLFSRTVLDPSNYIQDDTVIYVNKGKFSGTLALYLEDEQKQTIRDKYGNTFPYTFSVKTSGNQQSFGFQNIFTYKKMLIANAGEQYLFIDFGMNLLSNDASIEIYPIAYPTYGYYKTIPKLNFEIIDAASVSSSVPSNLISVYSEVGNVVQKVQIGQLSQPLRFKIDKSYFINQQNPQIQFSISPFDGKVQLSVNNQITSSFQFIYVQNFNILHEYIGIQVIVDNDINLVGNQYQISIQNNNWFISDQSINIEIVQEIINPETNVEIIGVSSNSVLLDVFCPNDDKQNYLFYEIIVKNQGLNPFKNIDQILEISKGGIIFQRKFKDFIEQTPESEQIYDKNINIQDNIYGGFTCQKNIQKYNITQLNPGFQYVMKIFDIITMDTIKTLEFQTQALQESYFIEIQLQSRYIMEEQELGQLLMIDVDRVIMKAKIQREFLQGDVDLNDISNYNQNINQLSSIQVIGYYIKSNKDSLKSDSTLKNIKQLISQQSEIYNEFDRITGNQLIGIEIVSQNESIVSKQNYPYALPRVSYTGNNNENLVVSVTLYGGDGFVSVCVSKNPKQIDEIESLSIVDIQDLASKESGIYICENDILMKENDSHSLNIQFGEDYFKKYYFIFIRTTEANIFEDKLVTQDQKFVKIYVYSQSPNYVVFYIAIPLVVAFIFAIIMIIQRSHQRNLDKKRVHVLNKVNRSGTFEDFSEIDNKSNRTVDDKSIKKKDEGFLKNPFNRNREVLVKQVVLQEGKIVQKQQKLKGQQLKMLGEDLAKYDVDEIVQI